MFSIVKKTSELLSDEVVYDFTGEDFDFSFSEELPLATCCSEAPELVYRRASMGACGFCCALISEYPEDFQRQVWIWKDNPNQGITNRLTRLVCDNLPNKVGFDIVTTAPKKCERTTTYHPSEELARCVANTMGLPFVKSFHQRTIHRKKGKMSRDECHVPIFVGGYSGKFVLLVDDVCCSGGTARTSAQSIRHAGNSVEVVAALFWDRALSK
jgi:hypothetical protein